MVTIVQRVWYPTLLSRFKEVLIALVHVARTVHAMKPREDSPQFLAHRTSSGEEATWAEAVRSVVSDAEPEDFELIVRWPCEVIELDDGSVGPSNRHSTRRSNRRSQA